MTYKRTHDKAAEVTLPITPMLDMAFQLMFFFLATFNPSSVKEGQMELSLPSKSEAAAKDPSQVAPTAEAHKEDIDIPADFTINIRGDRDTNLKFRGKITGLIVTTNAGDEELKGTQDDREKQLKEKLLNVKPASGEGKDGKPKVPTVRMSAESGVRWEEVMRIMDVCYRTGFQVSFAKPPDLGSAQ